MSNNDHQPGSDDGPPPATTLAGSGRDDAVELVRSEERLHARVEWVSAERVRISKRIVTQTKTFTVQVRREELVVERFPAGGDRDEAGDHLDGDMAGIPPGAAGTGPVVELVLHEEVPEVTLRTVPTEWVLVYKDMVAGSVTVDASLRQERVELVEPPDG